MSPIYLATFLLFFVFSELNLMTGRVRRSAYEWWYIPWIALLYALIIYLVYRLFDLPGTAILDWMTEPYMMETTYCLVALVVWIPLETLLRKKSIHESLIVTFRDLFAKKDEDANSVYPFPYYYSEEKGKVISRVGRVFYRLTVKSVIIIVAAVYAIALIIAHYYGVFFPLSAFGILGLLPLLEYYFYLSAEVEEEEDETVEGVGSNAQSDFDLLWRLFVEQFDNYGVAWKRELDTNGKERRNKTLESNNSKFNQLFKDFKDAHKGGIIEDSDLLTAFTKLVPFFMDVIKEGHYILVLFDIPKHFSDSRQDSYLKEIAAQLTAVLVKRFPKINEITKFIVYDKESTTEVFDNSIVMASLTDLSRQKVEDREWMRNLGLVVAVNVIDKGVSNLYETRRFSYQLRTVNEDHRIIVISSFRKELEPSLENTWVTNREKVLPECQIKPCYHSERHYFIGYYFEEYEKRFLKVLRAHPNRELYSGSEMLVFPLSSRVGDLPKAITPVHQLELAYTSTIEGNEEIRNSAVFKHDYSVTFDSLADVVHPHVVPIDEIVETQAFSVIYDNENNSVSSYLKWVHLGNDESFTVVISKPYLFRDYFYANHDYFSDAPFAALQPRMCKSRITLAIILLSLLKEGKQDENAIKAHLNKYYDEGEIVSIPEKLKELFKTYFNENLANDLRTGEEVSFDGNSYHTHVKYWIADPDLINLPYLDIVQFKDNNGNVIFEILRDLLYQNYSKGQQHSFLGLPYTIDDFDPVNCTQNVSRSRDISNVLFYRPCYQVRVHLPEGSPTIKDLHMTAPITYFHHSGQELAYRMEAFETEISIATQAWVSFKRYESPRYSGGASKRIPTNATMTPERKYSRGKILKLSLRYLPCYAEKIDQIRKMLQILLYEGLQSLFPHHAQYLIVASKGEGIREGGQDILPWIFNDFQCDDRPQEGYLTFYFIEDAHIDLGLIGVLSYEAICNLFEYIYDYLIWLTEDPIIPEGYIEFLHRKDPDRLSFLKYGMKDLPKSYFDIELATDFIRDHFTFKKELTELQRKRSANKSDLGACDFCGAKVKNSEMTRLDDGRMRCNCCSKGAVDSQEQFQKVYERVKEAFKTHLGIDFDTIPHHANLVSAADLHRLGDQPFSVTNGYDIRKLVGLADDEIYVENGYKEDSTFGIIAHELTHIWEFNDPDFSKVRQTNEDLVEGLAVWTDLFLSEKNGTPNVDSIREAWLARTDEYGRGLRFILDHCPDKPYDYIRERAKTVAE